MYYYSSLYGVTTQKAANFIVSAVPYVKSTKTLRIKKNELLCLHIRDSSVAIATDYELDELSSISGRKKVFLSLPQRQERLWGPPSIVYNGHRRLFPRDKAAGRDADH
jgi:hypothetical protein